MTTRSFLKSIAMICSGPWSLLAPRKPLYWPRLDTDNWLGPPFWFSQIKWVDNQSAPHWQYNGWVLIRTNKELKGMAAKNHLYALPKQGIDRDEIRKHFRPPAPWTEKDAVELADEFIRICKPDKEQMIRFFSKKGGWPYGDDRILWQAECRKRLAELT